MGHIQEGDAQALLHALELQLHLLTQLQVQRAQGLVQQQHLGLVDQTSGDGHALLLAAGKGIHMALAVALQIDQVQHSVYPAGNLSLGELFQLQTEGDVVKHVQVGEQGILLKHGVHPALVGRNVGNLLALKKQLAA